jgi:hypothetical protein
MDLAVRRGIYSSLPIVSIVKIDKNKGKERTANRLAVGSAAQQIQLKQVPGTDAVGFF